MPVSTSQALASIGKKLLNEESTAAQLQQALDDYAAMASAVTGIDPDPGYQAWSDDSFLDYGIAINPQAAAFCITDYPRTVAFIRGVFASIKLAKQRFDDRPLQILYAGCGPFAPLLLPLLGQFDSGQLAIHLLDFHPRSLHAAEKLIQYFGLGAYSIQTIQADACSYQHPGPLHVIVAETMQKSLEQEPQFMVTANLAPQLCHQGIFIPERIEVELCLCEKASGRQQNSDRSLPASSNRHYPLARLLSLTPGQVLKQLESARHNKSTGKLGFATGQFQIPAVDKLDQLDAMILTRIQVYGPHCLEHNASQISLPSPCNELGPLQAGANYDSCYELGAYPRFSFTRIEGVATTLTQSDD